MIALDHQIFVAPRKKNALLISPSMNERIIIAFGKKKSASSG
jgi:hypothetical protein